MLEGAHIATLWEAQPQCCALNVAGCSLSQALLKGGRLHTCTQVMFHLSALARQNEIRFEGSKLRALSWRLVRGHRLGAFACHSSPRGNASASAHH